MAYIGNIPADKYTSFAKQDFTVTATTSYTLDHSVSNENEIELFINFVRQEPTTAYTCSSNQLTLTEATSVGDDMYCVFLGKAVQTVNPPSGSVGLDQLSATGTKDSTTFLRGDNSFQTVSSYSDSDALSLFNASGSAPVYACRAWVNFNGTGTVAIRDSGNVSSITDNGTGDYTINFTTAMPDTNYCVTSTSLAQISSSGNLSRAGVFVGIASSSDSTVESGAFQTGSITIQSTKGSTASNNGNVQDVDTACVAIFR